MIFVDIYSQNSVTEILFKFLVSQTESRLTILMAKFIGYAQKKPT